MKRTIQKLILLFAMLMSGMVMEAAPVDMSTARKVGFTFMNADSKVPLRSIDDLQLVTTYNIKRGDTAFYIFNTQKGFVIVSADDCAVPILGYSNEVRFDVNDIPIQLQDYLQGFVEQIENGIENHLEADETTACQWELVRTFGYLIEQRSVAMVEPMLTDSWHQTCYYNNCCPVDSNGPCGHVYAGCSATSLSQILRYWGYPIMGTGSNTYTPPGYPEQTVNFGATTYDWANMPDKLTSTSSTTQIDAVATLMWHCGVAVNMVYGAQGSGANEMNIIPALVNYFGYSDELSMVFKENYSDEEWLTLMKNCLDLGRPVLYCGWDASSGGHGFVCDGYDANNLLHFNWGWGGSNNGYYSITAMNPGNYAFTYNNLAIINIQPDYIQSFHFVTAGNWSETSNWSNNALPGAQAEVFIEAPCSLDMNAEIASLSISDGSVFTLQSGKLLTVTGNLTNSEVTCLVIKDGAQLINASANVAATMEKDVTAFGSGNPDGWYTISSPMNGMPIAGSNFLMPNYDLYRFNETNLTSEEWENYKADLADFTTFENGRGYLYANSSTFSPAFTGTLNASDVTIPLTCTERPNDPFSGFNLIGNPFPHDIYKGAGGAIDNAYLASGYYTLTNEGTWEPHTFDDAIQPGQGILVKATAPINLTIAKSNEEAYSESGGAKTGTAFLRISVEGDDGRDCAFVYFGHGVGLDKVEDLDQNAPSLAIRNENGDFAIAHFDKKSGIIELVFSTPGNGDATLKVKVVNSDFNALHLIDPTTGADIDLLQQASYTFSALGQAGERHFKLIYKRSEN